MIQRKEKKADVLNPEEHNNPVLFVNEVLNLDLEHSNSVFSQSILANDDVQSN